MPGTIPVTASEHNEYSAAAGYIPFLAISITVIALMVSGLLQAGNAAARDWERGTVKEILGAPAPRSAILAGQMAGAYLAALPAAVIVLAVVTAVSGAWPANPGVFGALTFQTPAVQAIGAFQPVHYAIVLEQMAFRGYGTGTLPLGADAAILGGYAAVFAVLAAAALRFSGRAIRKAG
jgi:hypothetical protein